MARPPRPTRPAPEHWSTDAGHSDVARLDIPADATRERRFEVFVSLQVRCAPGQPEASHGLRVLVDGALAWTRRVPTHASGEDSLDYRLRCTVPAGRPLRLSAQAELRSAINRGLRISAEEDPLD